MDFIVLNKYINYESAQRSYLMDADSDKWSDYKNDGVLFRNMKEVMNVVKQLDVKLWAVEVITKPDPSDIPFVVPPRMDGKIIETKTSRKKEREKLKRAEKNNTPNLFD